MRANPQFEHLSPLNWGCAKGAAKRACGKTVVQTPKNGQQQALNQKPAARLPRKDSHFLDQGQLQFQISVCWMPLNRKRTLWNSQTDCQDTALLIGTVTKDERSVFQFSHIYLEQNTRTPMKTRVDSSKHSEAICVRDAGRNPQFSWTIFPDKKCTLQNLPMDSPKRRNGLCFARGLSVLRKNAFLEKNSALQPTTLEAPKCVVTV